MGMSKETGLQARDTDTAAPSKPAPNNAYDVQRINHKTTVSAVDNSVFGARCVPIPFFQG